MSYEAWGDNDDEYMTPEQAVEMGWLSPDDCTTGMWDVFNERIRQRNPQPHGEGYSDERDDGYRYSQLTDAAISYCLASVAGSLVAKNPPPRWPWSVEAWKPKDRRSNLVRAAALLIAEIDRQDRASKRGAGND